MNIAIDATTLLLRSAGVKNHLYYWLISLREAAPLLGDTVSTYPAAVPLPPVINHETSSAGPFGTICRLALVHFANIRSNPARDILLRGKDVFHCSQHTAFVPRRAPSTATVFDLSCWTVPDSHTPENIANARRYAEKILKYCDALIAISGHARDDAIEHLRLERERIRVIYPGVPNEFFSVSAQDAQAVRQKYQLPSTYILFVGCIEPRKNVAGLIRAYDRLPAAIKRDVQLVIAGPFGWEADVIRELLHDQRRNLRYLGYVPEHDLPGLIHSAATLVYPSYYEGFGLPVAQAMAAGVPVITSDRASLPEVVGDAGVMVDPNAEEQLSAAVERVLSSPELARDLGNRGKNRAERFRLSLSASESLKFFHDVAGIPFPR